MTDRIAIVTGGSGGIGAAVCRALSDTGHHVLVGYRSSDEAAAKVAADCAGPAAPIALDITEDAQVDAAVARARELGDLAVLVNAAGTADDDLVLRTDADRFAASVETNLNGTYRVTRAALRPMLRARYGRIVSIASIVALRGNPGQAAYGAAKAGVIGLTRSLAREVARKGVTVNAVAPGFVETAMTDQLSEEVRQGFLERTPIARAVTAEEVAAAVAFLAGESAGAITGTVLPVDGGAAI